MKDLETLRTLAGDRTPFTDLEWRKKLLTQIEAPSAKPFVRQALAHIREMEAGIRSNSPLFTREHAREARSNIRTLLSKAIESIQTTQLTDKELEKIANGAKQITGRQDKAFKIYKGVPVTITNFFGPNAAKLNQLLKHTMVQGYPVYMNQTVVGINRKAALKELKGVNVPGGDKHDAHHLDFFESDETSKKIIEIVHKYRNLIQANWEIVSGQVYRKDTEPTAYVWIAPTPKLAEHIGKLVSGQDKNWAVATFAAPVSDTDNTKTGTKYPKSLIIEIFDLASRMKAGPTRRVDYQKLADYYANRIDGKPINIPVDVVKGILNGTVQEEDTKELAKNLNKWRA